MASAFVALRTGKTMRADPEVTELLRAMSEGDAEALGRLVPQVYDHLRRLARRRLARERAGHTLDTTGLVHEAYLRLAGAGRVAWQNRGHFFAVASRIMRRILVDGARKRRAGRRGGGAVALSLDETAHLSAPACEAVLGLDAALERLRTIDPRRSLALEYHYFGGLTTRQTAEALAVSPGTVERDLRFARAWLAEQLHGSAARAEAPCGG